ncbi:radical SAM protein [Gorillibacterium massiliense]|uniref:radical SAM protein n=1 Tax=Gorillibacterium massiliense TaxID=1280390 RepID=UPI0004BA0276|nr:radical SAM protein [Gorillibacterium massiliense]
MGGCGVGTAAVQADRAEQERYGHLARRHPCFSAEGHFKHGRLHLPVSPACNIQCKFCKRAFNKAENRPGVAASILPPDKAAETVTKALALCPDITVAGIAGPGDTLATPHALEAFELIRQEHPGLIHCLSTNGLLLEGLAERIAAAGVQTVTVTVNGVDPGIVEQIVSAIVLDGRAIRGREAAETLIGAQLAGIRKAASLGLVVKINTVLIPGINDSHIGEIAAATRAAGASLINVIPLIPQHELSHIPAPDCFQLSDARRAAEEHLPVFRHCQQCRADACGIPGAGRDFASQLYDQPLEETFSHG